MLFSLKKSLLSLSVTLCLVAVIGTGCAFKVNEGPVAPGVASMSSTDMNCLSKNSKTFSNFLDGTASEASINQLAACATKSLKTFGDLTRGATPGVYTPFELRNFLSRYFLNGLVVTDAFVVQTMVLKQTLMGGNTTELTLADLNHVIQMIETSRQQFVKLRSFMPLDLTTLANKDAVAVDATAAALVEVADAFGKMIEEAGVPYSFKKLSSFLEQLKTLMPDSPTSDYISTNISMFAALKGILISPSGDLISGQDWSLILKQAARWYGIYARFTHLNANYSDLTLGEGRVRLLQIISDSANVLEEAIDRHGGVILFEEIENLINLYPSEKIAFSAGFSVQKVTINTILRPVVNHMLGGLDPEGRNAPGVTSGLFERILDTIDHWSEGQRYLEGLYGVLDGQRSGRSVNGYTAEELTSVSLSAALDSSGGLTDTVSVVANDLIQVIKQSRPLFIGDNAEITFPGPTDEHQRSLHNLAEMNWMRQMIKLIMQGYAQDHDRGKNYQGLTNDEFGQFIQDLWPLLTDTLLVNPADKWQDEAANRFREANLFTPAANGDDLLSVDEGGQLFAFMLSAGHQASRIHAYIAEQCKGHLGEHNDIYGQPTIEPDCYRRVIFSRDPSNSYFEEVWKFMPGMATYYRTLPDSQLAAFQHNLEQAGRRDGYQEKVYFNSADSQTMSMIMHYVESIFSSFDRDNSRSLSYEEAQMAYPRFRNILTSVSGFANGRSPKEMKSVDIKVEALFTYLLKFGTPPVSADMKTGQKLKGALAFWAWEEQKTLIGWHFQSTRSDVLSVFAQIGKLTSTPTTPPPPATE